MQTKVANRLLKQVTKTAALSMTVTLCAILVILYFALDPGAFTASNIAAISNSTLPLAIAGIGETFVLLIGSIDLSIGSVMSLVSVVVATHMGNSIPSILVWSVIGIAIGGSVGLINAIIVEKFCVSAFIATLATMEIVGGVALEVLPAPGGSVPSTLKNAVLGTVGVFPISAIIMIGICIIWIFARRWRSIVQLLAVGSDRQRAMLNGIQVQRRSYMAYILSGSIAGCAGIAFASLLGGGDPVEGSTYLLPAIAAIVIGGTSIFGGRGGLPGTVLGALLLTILADTLFAVGITAFWETFVTGAITVFVVGAAVGFGKMAERGRAL